MSQGTEPTASRGSRPHPTHLVRRFFATLWPAPPRPADERFAVDAMIPGERDLWWQMCRADRRHAIGVAYRVVAIVGDGSARRGQDGVPAEGRSGGEERDEVGTVPRPVIAAALLHDVGKIESGLGAVGRSVATVAALMAGRQRLARRWGERRGWIGRAGRYLDHPAIGAGMLCAAGSDPMTVQWTAEHHRAPAHWEVPAPWSRVLKDADND